MYNSLIRSINLQTIDFSKVSYQVMPLDREKKQAMEEIKVYNQPAINNNSGK